MQVGYQPVNNGNLSLPREWLEQAFGGLLIPLSKIIITAVIGKLATISWQHGCMINIKCLFRQEIQETAVQQLKQQPYMMP